MAMDAVIQRCVEQSLNPEACSFDPGTLGPDGSKVLTARQVASLKNIFAGPKNSKGEELYAGRFWDPGIAGGGWRQWKMGSDQPSLTGAKANSSLNLSPFAGGGAIAYVLSTPPNRATRSGDVAGCIDKICAELRYGRRCAKLLRHVRQLR